MATTGARILWQDQGRYKLLVNTSAKETIVKPPVATNTLHHPLEKDVCTGGYSEHDSV